MNRFFRRLILLLISVLLIYAFHRQLLQYALKSLVHSSMSGSEVLVNSVGYNMKDSLTALKLANYTEFSEALNNVENVKLLEEKLSDKSNTILSSIRKCELSYQYMLAGDIQSALTMVDEIESSTGNIAKGLYRFKDYAISTYFSASYYKKNIHRPDRLRGILYLRLAEYENCQQYTSRSGGTICSIPFSDLTIHKNTFGAEMAIYYFESDLKKSKKKDLTTQWLLNICYSVLGRYPEMVPKEYLIDINHYQSSHEYPAFEDYGFRMNVDVESLYGGTCLDDFDGDGLLDLITTSGELGGNVHYFKAADSSYIDHTNQANLDGIVGGVNVIQGDFNNDSRLDLYILRGGWLSEDSRYHPNSLLKQEADGSFTDVTNEAGLLSFTASHSAVFSDFNNDGWLDIFVGNENSNSQLFINQKDESFKEVSFEAGIKVDKFVKGVAAGDVNDDGWQDLFLSNYAASNILYLNTGQVSSDGVPTFVDNSSQANIKKPIKSFSTAMFDFNNDGLLDIFCPAYEMDMDKFVAPYLTGKYNLEPSMLYLNSGNGIFNPISSEHLERSLMVMGMNFGDIDNDGWEDIYLGTGYASFEVLLPNILLRNMEGDNLEDITFTCGLGVLQKSHGIAINDIDRDGDQDVYLSTGGFFAADNFKNSLFLNMGNENKSFTIKLQGRISNRSAIGSTIDVYITDRDNSRRIYRTVTSGGSYGASALEQTIGVGQATIIDSICINWPASGIDQTFYDLEVGQFYSLIEGSDSLLVY